MFLLISNKQKARFVNTIVTSVDIALKNSGKTLSYTTRFNLNQKLLDSVHYNFNKRGKNAGKNWKKYRKNK